MNKKITIAFLLIFSAVIMYAQDYALDKRASIISAKGSFLSFTYALTFLI